MVALCLSLAVSLGRDVVGGKIWTQVSSANYECLPYLFSTRHISHRII